MARIIERGRGPEIEGTRVTVYRIMDFLRDGATPERIALDLDLTMDEVHVALGYVAAHAEELEQTYLGLLKRAEAAHLSRVDDQRAATPEELRARIKARMHPETAHAGPAGQ